MKSVSIYQSELTFSNNKSGQLISSIKHSMRVEHREKNINYNYSKSGNNIIFYGKFQGVKVKDLTEIQKLELLDELENFLIEKEQPKTIDPKILKNLKRDFKSAIKTDIDAILKRKPRDKNLTDEQLKRRRDLTKKIFNYLDDGLKGNVLTDKELLEYRELVNKNRFDKVLKIKNENLNKKNFDNKTIQCIESIFKIPVDNNVNITARESKTINEDFYKTYFPNYEIVASFEHNDEILEKVLIDKNDEIITLLGGNHTHNFIKTKNKITGEYDYSKTKYNLVKNQLLKEWEGLKTKEDYKNWYFNSNFELENIPEDFLNLENNDERIKYLIGELSNKDKRYAKTQNKRFGIIYQNIVFEFVNNHQIFKDRDLKATKYINMGDTREEIFKKKNKLSLQDKNLMNKRDFSGAELEKQNKKILDELNKKLEKSNEEQNTILKKQIEAINKADKIIKSKENKITQKNQLLFSKDNEIEKTNNLLDSKTIKLEKKGVELTEKEAELVEKENEIKRLTNVITNQKEEIEELKKITDYREIETSVKKNFFNKYFEKVKWTTKNLGNKFMNIGKPEMEQFYKVEFKKDVDFDEFFDDMVEYTKHQRINQLDNIKDNKINELENTLNNRDETISKLQKEKIAIKKETIIILENKDKKYAELNKIKDNQKNLINKIKATFQIDYEDNNLIDSLNDYKNRKNEKLTELEKDNEKLSNEIVEVKETNKKIFDSREDVIKERDEAKTELEKSKTENAYLTFENISLSNKNRLLEKSIETLTKGINYFKKEFIQVKRYFSSFTKRVISAEEIEEYFNDDKTGFRTFNISEERAKDKIDERDRKKSSSSKKQRY